MAIRVTHVQVEVLLTGPTLAEMVSNLTYAHDYNAGDLAFVAAYDVETGLTLEGPVGSGAYYLAGFVQSDAPLVQGNHDIEALLQQENAVGSGKYTLNVYAQSDMTGDAHYALNAFVTLDGQHYGRYDLNAYEAEDQVFHSQYDLDAYLIATGYMNGVYGVDVYTDLLMQLVSAYDLLSFEQVDAPGGLGTYDLNAWELREQATIATYALNVFQASTGYLDTQSAIDAFAALEQRYGVSYDLNALMSLTGFGDASYAIDVLTSQQMQLIAGYDLLVYEVFNGLADATYALNAYQAADGFTDGQYGISVFVGLTGYGDASYLLDALTAQTGSFDGTYLLDTFQELYTWVINQNTGAPARYENYDFDAFAVIGQNYLGARGDGIYLLDGDDDEGAEIDAIATTANTDLEEAKLKRVTGAYLGVQASGQVHLTLRTDQDQESGPYRLRQSPDTQTTERAKFRRGIRTRYVQVDMENTDGEDVKIDTLELEASVVSRRLKK
jgi:hypothetical protein